MDFDMREELLFLIYLILLYYILVVLVILIKSKVLEKFLKLFLWYTFGIQSNLDKPKSWFKPKTSVYNELRFIKIFLYTEVYKF